MSEEFDKLLNSDPFREAEKLTGKSYKEDKGTQALAFLLHMDHQALIAEELALRDDTYFQSPLRDVLRIYREEGFDVVYSTSFFDRGHERFHYILWDGACLAVVDSYSIQDGAPIQNKNVLYFNWRRPDGSTGFPDNVSGGWHRNTPGYEGRLEDDPWTLSGNVDGRVGLRNKLAKFRAEGSFISPWLDSPTLDIIPKSEQQISRIDTMKDAEDWRAERRDAIDIYLPEEIANAVRGSSTRD